ncbi:MAG: protein kinase [Labilithrix sp.]|nr:protein kinase [Labilithrix sp.]
MSDDDFDSLLRKVARAPHRSIAHRIVDDERYVVGEVLGEGSFGVVYEAFDRERRENVALKVLKSPTSEGLVRFKREFRELSRLHDPNFVRLYDLHGGSCWYFTMERAFGVAFDAWARDSARLRAALDDLVQALGRLHQEGFVHRDVKPSNVIVDPDGRLKLLDFGLVYVASDTSGTNIAGTPVFVAPEVAAGDAPTAASDWYAVGVMLYEILTGELPISGSAAEILRAKQDVDAPPVLSRAPHAPADLAELADALLQRDPGVRTSAMEGWRGASVRRTSASPSRFVGRRAELATVERLLDPVRSVGDGMNVLRVIGDSGVGKSALVDHLAWVARQRGMRVLQSRCHPSAHVPFVALDGIVDDLARLLRHRPPSVTRALAPRDAGDLATTFPVLRSIAGFDERTKRDGARSGVANGLGELLARWDDRRHWLLLIDDAQWGDADSAAVLAEIFRARALPASLVLAHRTDASGPLVNAFAGSSPELRLGPLGDDDARELARHAGATEDVDAVARESAGHPLFLLELVRERERAGTHRSLQEIIAARFAGLSPAAQRGARILAIAERPVALVVLRALDVQTQAIDELREAGLTRRYDVHTVGTHHDRIREILVATSLRESAPESLRPLHRSIAQALLAANPDDAEAAGVHFEHAGHLDAAARELLRAARMATSARAYSQARALYARVLSLRERTDPGDADVALRLECAEASAHAGMSVEAADGFLAAATRTSRAQGLFLRLRAAEQLLTSGHVERGQRVLDAELRQLGLSVASTTPGQVFELVRARVGRQIDRLGTRASDDARFLALWSAYRSMLSAKPMRAAALGASLVREAARPGASAHARVAGTFIDAFPSVASRGPDALPRALFRLSRAAEGVSEPGLLQLTSLTEGLLVYYGLDIQRSAASFDRALAIGEEHELGRNFEETMSRAFRSAVAWVLGDVSHLRTHVKPACAEFEERNHLFAWLLFAGHHSWLTLMERGIGDDATKELDEIRRRVSSSELEMQAWWVDIGRIHFALARGDGRTAWELSRPQARPLKERMLSTLMHRLEAQTFLVRAAIHMAKRRRGAAKEEIALSHRRVAVMSEVPSQWSRGHALSLRACLSSISGDRDATLRALRAARPALADAGMPLLGTLVELALGRTIAGDEGAVLVRAAEARLEGWRVDRDTALACTLPGVF